MDVECYAQRMLNPFHGSMHVIRYDAAEAVTSDGAHWDIYVRNSALVSDLAAAKLVQTSDIRYGSWSAEKGLKRGPVNPYEDFLNMEAMGAVVYAHLTKAHEQVPFPFRDVYECWLLDQDGLPLALLESATAEDEMGPISPQWRAGYAASERFRSQVWMDLAGAEQCRGAADYLTRYVNSRAGPAPIARWFLRDAEGGGVALDHAIERGRHWLPRADFPALLLDSCHHDSAHATLIKEYLDWQAPWLLLLPGLDQAERSRLEKEARHQAAEVARHYRLYPEIVSQDEINAALVESVLVNSSAAREYKLAEEMPTYYIELNPGGGEYL